MGDDERRAPVPEAVVRAGRAEDLAAINDIYNHYVLETAITFEVDPVSMAARRAWFEHYGPTGRHRLFVAADGDEVLGYATSGRYQPRPAYETSVEVSVYLDPGSVGRGLGSTLYATLLAALEPEDVHRAYGGVAVPNPASVALHERFGFRQAGYFTEQGRKFGRYWDVAHYEKAL
jgi:phosphinothricin acetyltransferase